MQAGGAQRDGPSPAGWTVSTTQLPAQYLGRLAQAELFLGDVAVHARAAGAGDHGRSGGLRAPGGRGVSLGYKGSYRRARASFRAKRLSADPGTTPPPSPRTVAGWILRHPDTLTRTERLRI